MIDQLFDKFDKSRLKIEAAFFMHLILFQR